MTPQVTGYVATPKEALLYPEARAKALAADLQIGDMDWKWEAVLVNAEKGLWAVQFTDEQGHTERVSL